LTNYRYKADTDNLQRFYRTQHFKKGSPSPDDIRKSQNRTKGINLAVKKIETKEETTEAVHFPNLFEPSSDDSDNHRAHRLHRTLVDHGYAYSHTTPVSQKDGNIRNHFTWTHPTGHLVGSFAGKTDWTSKVSSSSGHSFEGIGTEALGNHLASKFKRYKLQNNEGVAHTNILENLLGGHDTVTRYAQWMNNNPQTAFGHQGSYDVQSPKVDLLEAHRLREEHAKKFPKKGKRRNKWSLFDQRMKGQAK